MNKSTILVIMEVILIIILVGCIELLDYRTNQFSRDCHETFDLNASCPCTPPMISNLNYNYPNFSEFNFSS
jgi:hypothetical protein